ncbi:MAG: cupin domain-containing protein [Hyphomicrobiaceae bacterium]
MKYVDHKHPEWIEGDGYKKRILLREDSLNCPGTLVQLVRIEPRAVVADHYHKSCTEVFYGMSGSGVFEINGEAFNLSSGDVLTCEPFEIHNTKNSGYEPLIYVVFKTNVTEKDLYWC